MGVLSVRRDSDIVAREVGSANPVAVISCNNCIRGCGAGGEEHLPKIVDELKRHGVSVEETILVTNPCSRGYIENYPFSPAIKTTIVYACPGTQAGILALFPDMKVVAGVDSLGLMISSKAKGRLKLIATFPGYEDLMGKEYKMGDTNVAYDDEVLKANDNTKVEVES